MDLPQALHKLSSWVQEDICLVASESPGMAAEKAALHDARLEAYKCAIFSLVTEYDVVNHLQTAQTIDQLVDRSTLEKEAAEALREYELDQASTQYAEQVTAVMDDTIANFNQLAELWQEVQAERAKLLKEVQQVADSHMEALTPSRGGEAVETWKEVTSQMKEERQTLQNLIKALDGETAEIHENLICDHLRAIDTGLVNITQMADQRRQVENELRTYEATMANTHGILADEEPEDYESYLKEELSLVAELYNSQAAIEADALEVEMKQLSSKSAQMLITPRQDWMRKLRRGSIPILKWVAVTFSEDSAYPQNIQVKVDLSAVPANKADEVQRLLGAAIEAWKAQQQKQTSFELSGLIKIFFTKPPPHNNSE